MGRPLLSPSLRREWIYSVYFTEAEYHDVSRTASKKGHTIAKFLREAALEKMEREKEAQ